MADKKTYPLVALINVPKGAGRNDKVAGWQGDDVPAKGAFETTDKAVADRLVKLLYARPAQQ